MKTITKGELLRWLEPFTDSIKVVVEEDMAQLDAPNPQYLVGGTDPDFAEQERKMHIERGEGYIRL
jgi:hypothetical protein